MFLKSTQIFQNNIYCMHGVNESILEMIKEFPNKSILTFDDGLRSLVKYRNELLNLKKEKDLTLIIFINPYFILKSEVQTEIYNQPNYEYIECFLAHERARDLNIFDDYMNLYEILVMKNSGFLIGLHGWDHFIYNKALFSIKMAPNPVLFKAIKKDINYMINFILPRKSWFKTKYGLLFAWPYNNEIPLHKQEMQKIFKRELQKYYKNLIYFGSERLNGSWNSYFKEKNKKE